MGDELKCLIDPIIGKENYEDFCRWAFGPKYKEFNKLIQFADAWNKRHKIDLKINPDKPIVYDVIKMTELWKNMRNL